MFGMLVNPDTHINPPLKVLWTGGEKISSSIKDCHQKNWEWLSYVCFVILLEVIGSEL